MLNTGLALTVALLSAAGGNLLVNPSFEVASGGRVAGWNLFVQPHPTADGRLDRGTAFDGNASVELRTGEPYAVDPWNNWSQNVSANLGGKSLNLTGYIRTRDAEGACLLVQCWQRDSRGLVRIASSGETTPVSGTRDWTLMSLKVDVPARVAFVTVRCVLRGTGTAWFDNLALDEYEEDALSENLESAGFSAPGTGGPSREAKSAAGAKTMTQTLESLRESNEKMSQEVSGLQKEIRTLREQVQAGKEKGKGNPAGACHHVPPLVPHRFDREPSP